MKSLWLLGALAYGDPSALSSEPVGVRAWLEQPGERGGVLVVQAVFDPDGSIDAPMPAVEGLDFEPEGEAVRERIGDRAVVTWRYRFRGAAGSYEIPALGVQWRGPEGEEETRSEPLWVDLGVEPPRPGELADIVGPDPVWVMPWGTVVALGGAGLLVVAGAALAFGRARVEPEALPPERPDQLALRRWEAVRHDDTLDDFAKAQALSRVFRDYAESVLAFPATAWTTTQILAQLGAMAHLEDGNVPRARRLLRATDRVKYAEVRPGTDFFDDLDADLRAFVASTRPREWSPP